MEATQIQAFKEENLIVIRDIYDDHRAVFLNFGRKYGLEHDDLIDIYQDAFVVLRKQAINGKLNSVNSSMRTYLFGIGKNMIFNELKRQNKMVRLPENNTESYEAVAFDLAPSLSPEQEALRVHFKKLGKKCREVLTMFYYRGLSIEEITQQAEYHKESVVRSTKSRCLKQLKQLIKFPKV